MGNRARTLTLLRDRENRDRMPLCSLDGIGHPRHLRPPRHCRLGYALLVALRATTAKRRSERATRKARRCEPDKETRLSLPSIPPETTYCAAPAHDELTEDMGGSSGLLQLVGPRLARDPEPRPLDRRRKTVGFHPERAGSRKGRDRRSAGRRRRCLAHRVWPRRCVRFHLFREGHKS